MKTLLLKTLSALWLYVPPLHCYLITCHDAVPVQEISFISPSLPLLISSSFIFFICFFFWFLCTVVVGPWLHVCVCVCVTRDVRLDFLITSVESYVFQWWSLSRWPWWEMSCWKVGFCPKPSSLSSSGLLSKSRQTGHPGVMDAKLMWSPYVYKPAPWGCQSVCECVYTSITITIILARPSSMMNMWMVTTIYSLLLGTQVCLCVSQCVSLQYSCRMPRSTEIRRGCNKVLPVSRRISFSLSSWAPASWEAPLRGISGLFPVITD